RPHRQLHRHSRGATIGGSASTSGARQPQPLELPTQPARGRGAGSVAPPGRTDRVGPQLQPPEQYGIASDSLWPLLDEVEATIAQIESYQRAGPACPRLVTALAGVERPCSV